MVRLVRGMLLVAVMCSAPSLYAQLIQIDFEGLADGTPVTNQFPGVDFSDATVISAGISLNELEFPPHSGTNVVFDDGGPLALTFLTPALSFDGFFTYTTSLTIAPFDESNNALSVVSSAFSSNIVSSGNSPNEELSASFAGGISRIVITGDPAGSSFTLDDVSINFAPQTGPAVPEPSSVLLLSTGIALAYLLYAIQQRRRVRSSEGCEHITNDL
jgi:hypothetical protein